MAFVIQWMREDKAQLNICGKYPLPVINPSFVSSLIHEFCFEFINVYLTSSSLKYDLHKNTGLKYNKRMLQSPRVMKTKPHYHGFLESRRNSWTRCEYWSTHFSLRRSSLLLSNSAAPQPIQL